MEEYSLLLRNTKASDKIKLSVLINIAESLPHKRTEIINSIIEYTEDNFEEGLRIFIGLIKKDEDYREELKNRIGDLKTIANSKKNEQSNKLIYNELLKMYKDVYLTPESSARVDKPMVPAKPALVNNLPVPVEFYFYDLIEKNDYLQSVKKFSYFEKFKEETERVGKESVEAEDLKTKPILKTRKEETEDILSENKKRRKTTTDKMSFFFPKLQCKICALRFSEDEEGKKKIGSHLEEHSRKSRLLRDKDCISRDYFPTADQWLKNISKLVLMYDQAIENEKVISGGKVVMCSMCGEKMEVAWDDDVDDWILKDAICIKKEDENKFCHRECIL